MARVASPEGIVGMLEKPLLTAADLLFGRFNLLELEDERARSLWLQAAREAIDATGCGYEQQTAEPTAYGIGAAMAENFGRHPGISNEDLGPDGLVAATFSRAIVDPSALLAEQLEFERCAPSLRQALGAAARGSMWLSVVGPKGPAQFGCPAMGIPYDGRAGLRRTRIVSRMVSANTANRHGDHNCAEVAAFTAAPRPARSSSVPAMTVDYYVHRYVPKKPDVNIQTRLTLPQPDAERLQEDVRKNPGILRALAIQALLRGSDPDITPRYVYFGAEELPSGTAESRTNALAALVESTTAAMRASSGKLPLDTKRPAMQHANDRILPDFELFGPDWELLLLSNGAWPNLDHTIESIAFHAPG